MEGRFVYEYRNEELEKQFEEKINEVAPNLFANSNVGFFKVSYLDMKSVINDGGAYREVLKQVATIEVNTENNSSGYAQIHHLEIIQEIVNKSTTGDMGSFVKLMNRLKKYVKAYQKSFKNTGQPQYNVIRYDDIKNIV